MANYFGLEELMERLKEIQKKEKRKCYPEVLHLCLKRQYTGKNETFKIRKNKMTRVSGSTIARYLNGEDCYLPIVYDEKLGIFSVEPIALPDSELFENFANYSELYHTMAFNFLNSIDWLRAQENNVPGIKEVLKVYGIQENLHYKVENDEDEDYEGFSILKWNNDFVLTYTDSELSELQSDKYLL